MTIPLVVMTSPATEWVLPGFFDQLRVHGVRPEEWITPYVYGYDETVLDLIPQWARDGFTTIGKFADFPHDKWSDSMMHVLHDLRDARKVDVFWFMLDDYWIVRDIDRVGVRALYDFHLDNHTSVIKVDLGFDRLYSYGPDAYNLYMNTDRTVGHLDLIKGFPDAGYHMSLWGGLFSTELMLKLVRPGWTPQQVELDGTPELRHQGYTVYGTRQSPVLHTNVCHNGNFFSFPGPKISDSDMKRLRHNRMINVKHL